MAVGDRGSLGQAVLDGLLACHDLFKVFRTGVQAEKSSRIRRRAAGRNERVLVSLLESTVILGSHLWVSLPGFHLDLLSLVKHIRGQSFRRTAAFLCKKF